MKKIIPFLFFLLPLGLFAQTQNEETQAVEKVIRQLFDGMRAGDTTMMAPLFDPSARLQTTYTTKTGNAGLHTGPVDDWLTSVATPHQEVYDEQIFSYRTEIDGRLATVWTDYTFYLDDKPLHCGVNAFHLFKSDAGWKILQVTDTRRTTDCQKDPRRQIDTLMNNWHHAAAVADEDTFFGSMTADAVYLGTDATERWLRDELKTWSAAFFAKDSAWDFTPSRRQIYFAPDGKTAWLEEALDTWMGPCRGSAVVSLTAEGWKIRHYDLSMMVPNDKVDGFLELMKQ